MLTEKERAELRPADFPQATFAPPVYEYFDEDSGKTVVLGYDEAPEEAGP